MGLVFNREKAINALNLDIALARNDLVEFVQTKKSTKESDAAAKLLNDYTIILHFVRRERENELLFRHKAYLIKFYE